MKKLKLKVRPEDFMVDEIATLPLAQRGEYAAYRLRKRGWNTVDALRRCAQMLNLPAGRLAYGGKKDRYGLTTQWITIQDPAPREVREPNFSLEFLGHAAEPMTAARIAGNRFEIAVRDLDVGEAHAALRELEAVKTCGCPNYFDDQRFGGYDARFGFMAEHLLQRRYAEALKACLCSTHPEDKKPEKERKRGFAEHWGDWQACRRMAAAPFERAAFSRLAQRSGDYIPLLQRIPREDWSMAVSAFQSFLWNELARRLLQAQKLAARIFTGAAGNYWFYDRPAPEALRALDSLILPTPDARAAMPTALAARLYDGLLAERNLTRPLFTRLKVPQAFFKSVGRKFVLKPQTASARTAEDELYPGRTKLQLRFTLPRGGYATMIIKRLFALPIIHSRADAPRKP